MNAKEFLLALNEADDAFVQQAGIRGGFYSVNQETSKQHRVKHLWLAAAAFALVVLSGGAWLLLRGPVQGGESGLSGRETQLPDNTIVMEGPEQGGLAPTEPGFIWPEEEFPYPRAATLQELEDLGISLETYYEMLKNPAYMGTDGGEPGEINTDPELEAALLSLRVGGLGLGMPEAEVLARYGEPDAKSNSGPVTYEDGNTRVTWVYRMGEDAALVLEMIDTGDGYRVNEIQTSAALAGSLPFGMEIGQPLAEAEAALAQSPALYEARQEAYEEAVDEGVITVYAAPGEPGYYDRLSLVIAYRQDALWSVKLGPLYPDCAIPDQTVETQEEVNRRFESEEISVWLPDGSGWQGADYQEEEAKRLSAQFSISLPEPWDYDGSAPVAVLDFHNGYAAALFDAQDHGAVYRVTDREAFEQGLAAGDPLRGLALWEYGQFAPNTLQSVTHVEQVSADWDLNYNVTAPMSKLLPILREKDLLLFLSSDERTVLFREKGHFVLAYAYGEDERITGYARFFGNHTMEVVAGQQVPLIGLEEPAELLGMTLDAVKAAWGDPCFQTEANGETCPGCLTLSGYVVLLHLEGDTVTSLDLYDQNPTPTTIQ